MFEDLSGQTAIITGGARGLGYSLASALAQAGVNVGLVDVLDYVDESAHQLSQDHGVKAAGRVADVTDPQAVEAAFSELEAILGLPTLLVTAAGIAVWADSADMAPEAWRRVMSINVDGTFYAAQLFGRRLLEAGRGGSAILISSMSALIANVPQHQAAYNASKAAVSQLAKSLAVEWAPQQIRINAIAPGYFLSDMTRQFLTTNADLARTWTESIPLGRMGEPEDLHGLAVYLASDSSRYLTGQTIVIDGGYTSQ